MAESKSETLSREIRTILACPPPQSGAFEETVVLAEGVSVFRFPLATGLRWNMAQGKYLAAFGPIPDWLSTCHPAQRSQVCDLAVNLKQVLPAAVPIAEDGNAEPVPRVTPTPAKSSTQTAPAATRKSTNRDPLAAAVHDAVVNACNLEGKKSPFTLSGGGHEARLTLDRKLAMVLRGADVARVTIAGFGANNYYPLRVFKRAAASLRRELGWSPIAFSRTADQAYWVEQQSGIPAKSTGEIK